MTQSEGFFEHKRKWSTIKDDLLANYLRPYFTKILALLNCLSLTTFII